MILHSMAGGSITKVVMGETMTDDKIVVYIKEHEKREWLRDLPGSKEIYVKNIEAHYEDIECLNKNVTHILRCQKHVRNCALLKCIRSIQLVVHLS